jgi:hypothetical protein
MSQALLALVLSLALGSPVLPWVVGFLGNPGSVHSASEKAGSIWDPDGARAATGGQVDPQDAESIHNLNGAQADAGSIFDPNG